MRQVGFTQKLGRQNTRASHLRPDRREMTLARALRPDQHCETVRPVRPAFDHRQRLGVRRTFKKILTRETDGVIQRQNQLARRQGRRQRANDVIGVVTHRIVSFAHLSWLAGIERTFQITAEREAREETGLTIRIGPELVTVQHAYSHFRITLTAFTCTWVSGRARPHAAAELKWVTSAQLQQLPFPTANRRVIEAIETNSMQR